MGWECLVWVESPGGRTLKHVVPTLVTAVFPYSGNLCMVTGGANLGRIGVITNRERHPGSFDVVHVKDANGNSFATRLSNIFVIGKVRQMGASSRWASCEGLSLVRGCWLRQRALLFPWAAVFPHSGASVLASVLTWLPVFFPALGRGRGICNFSNDCVFKKQP